MIGTAVALPHPTTSAQGEKRKGGQLMSAKPLVKSQDPRKDDPRDGGIVEMEDEGMTYLVAPLHKVLRFLVSPFLPRPLFGQMHRLVHQLFLAFFAMWCPVGVPAPGECCCNVLTKAQRPCAAI